MDGTASLKEVSEGAAWGERMLDALGARKFLLGDLAPRAGGKSDRVAAGQLRGPRIQANTPDRISTDVDSLWAGASAFEIARKLVGFKQSALAISAAFAKGMSSPMKLRI
ncbi:unnamed protein product [Prorocentrum cordatum]|uniref:Uncharacterized protein n=1 Tax=Prorocentrum cordatum TaxID=2364126 RepID=A0ABN9W608_9DINO|nr:unnamed protein product [Polarella glacialis]